ncbi:MAG: PIG-L deacetylase family protein, partial [Sphingomonas sp.]|uniref:PIG-L deacetylase family protein n=1 Tax=Sphingomonas sp. TaxID=28214 RepID=UPI003F2ADCD7
AGHRLSWIVATDGAAAGGGRDRALAERRATEARTAAGQCGAALTMLGFADGELGREKDATAAIGQTLDAMCPDLIVTHAPNDYHPDHRALSRYVDWVAPLGTPILHSDNMLGRGFEPHFVVDIGDVIDAKRAALHAHESQRSLNFEEPLEIWSRFRALQAAPGAFRHGEAYRAWRGDPRTLLDDIGRFRTI